MGFDATLDLEKGDKARGSTSAATSIPARRLKSVSCAKALAQLLVVNAATGQHCGEAT